MALALKKTKPDFTFEIPSQVFDPELPQLGNEELSQQSVEIYLQELRQKIFTKMDQGSLAKRQVRFLSLGIDQLIIRLFNQAFSDQKAQVSLFALGGYGRSEMNLYSDIDILFIHGENSSASLESSIQKMLYPLWDAKIPVGYAVRNLKDCEKTTQQDVRVFSSMLDSRFLAGSQNLAATYLKFIDSKIRSPAYGKKFVEAKMKESEERLKRFGSSVYVTEPNLKESEGGLRDWHTLRNFLQLRSKTNDLKTWLSEEWLDHEEADQLKRSLEFLWNVRNRLHRRAGRAQDQLSFEYQEAIAQELKFENDGKILGVEKFMQHYYGQAANLHRLYLEVTRRLFPQKKSFFHKLRGKIRTLLNPYLAVSEGKVLPRDYKKLESHPSEIVRAFYLAQKNNLILDDDFKSWIQRNISLINDEVRADPEVCEMMREMFQDIGGIGKTLEEMHDCRLLGALIPEFGEILFQTQHDAYHVYTVDTHSIFAVKELSKLWNGEYDEEFPVLKQAILEVEDKKDLVLGVLFHDIGKGKGGNHSEVGAQMAQNIMTRLGYSEENRKSVEFLVLSHLIMPTLSQRRDLEDVSLIAQFAKTMETMEKLNLLFILTWADIRAVGPEVWTPWKGSLLLQLYQKTRQVLCTGEANVERAKVIKKQIIELILKAKHPSSIALQHYLESMPPRYFLAYPSEKIEQHYEIIHEKFREGYAFHIEVNDTLNCHELLLYTVNSPRLFEQVTGVMAANQVNILSLEQFFNSMGEALIILRLTDQRGELLESRHFTALEKDLAAVISGKIQLEKYYQSQQPSSMMKKKAITKAPRAEIDNMVSPYYSVIEIFANDRIGILYDLARVMRQCNLFIEVSKISTKVDQVADVFYVKDIFGHKITDRAKIQAIRTALLAALDQEKKES